MINTYAKTLLNSYSYPPGRRTAPIASSLRQGEAPMAVQ